MIGAVTFAEDDRAPTASPGPATRDIPVLVLSNSSREADVAEVMRLGAAGYLIPAHRHGGVR